MHLRILKGAIVIAAAWLLLAAGTAWALDCPHSDNVDSYGDCTANSINCDDCHVAHNALGSSLTSVAGNSNLCISCHTGGQLAAAKPLADADRADPYGVVDDRTDFQGTSHAWGVDAANDAAGAVSPSNTEMAARLDNGKITCSVCHDQHNHKEVTDGDAYPFLRISNAGSALCRECHTGRVDDTSPYSTHPIGVAIPGTTDYKSPSADCGGTPCLQLESGLVECNTCHSPHYADSGGANSGAGDGWILDISYTDICFDCHNFPTTGSHFNATTGALWPGPETVTFTSDSDYARSTGTVLLPHDATAGILSQPLPTSFRGACFNCHWPHGWPDGQGGKYDKLLVESNVGDLCFTCHDGDPVSPSVYDEFNPDPAYSDTSASGAAIDQKHDPAQLSCAKCHNPHYVTASNKVMDPDDTTQAWNQTYATGNTYTVQGTDYTYNDGNANDYDPTEPVGAPCYDSSPDINGCGVEPDYVAFCLACHDGDPPPGITLDSKMINIGTTYLAGGDQHGNQDGQKGSKVSKGYKKVPWTTQSDYDSGRNPAENYAAMQCTTCHSGHGSDNLFHLESSITVEGVQLQVGGKSGSEFSGITPSATYTLPLISGVQKDHYWGAWCTFCHELSNHPGVDENTACKDAHMHGGGAF